MLVQTRKTIFDDSEIAYQYRRRLRYTRFGRRLFHGIVATFLLSSAPAYAASSDATKLSLTNDSAVPASHRRTEAHSATHSSAPTRRSAKARRNVRVALRSSSKTADVNIPEAVGSSDMQSQKIAADATGEGDVVGRGIASWYSADKYNKSTSSGVPFDENAMTAASPWLPMGTRLRVTLQGSNTSVVVTINDRQGTKKRVIDLSKRAARELGILDRGIAHVTLTRL